MPRKPSRSANQKRPTRRDLDRRLDDLADREDYDDVDEGLTLAEVLNYTTETVDADAGIVRIVETGDLRRLKDTETDLADLAGGADR